MKIIVSLLLSISWAVMAFGQGSHVRADLIADRQTIQKDVPFHLGLKLKMDSHWHTYWENPRSSGLATQVSWKKLDGLNIAPLIFPPPKKFVDSVGFVTYGYEGEVVLIAKATYSGSAERVDLEGKVEWLECKDMCMPGSSTVRLTLSVGEETKPDPGFEKFLGLLPVEEKNSDRFSASSKIEFSAKEWNAQIRLGCENEANWNRDVSKIAFFPGPSDVSELKTVDAKFEGSELVLNLKYDVFDDQIPEDLAVWGLIQAEIDGRVQAVKVQLYPDQPVAESEKKTDDSSAGLTQPQTDGSEENWRPLADGFSVTARSSGYQGVDSFLGFLSGKSQGTFEGKSIWLIMLLVLVGGLALNFTPCVLPLIPINLSIIGAGAQAGSKVRGFGLGGMYGLGICLVYGALGLAVILGLSNAFGALNAKPWFNAVIAVIFVILALAMFDILVIDFTKYQSKLGVGQKPSGGFLLPLTMGAVSAFLAGACVAPVVISTIVYAQDQYTKGVVMALALPFLLGLGMAIPWPIAGAGLSFLPKPGQWMVRVKQVFGVLILAFALYYGYLAYSLASPQKTAHHDDSVWSHSLVQALSQAQTEGKPVVIDFWATWCKNCLTMDKTTFRNEEVVKALDAFVPVKFQAEDLDEEKTAEILEYFGAKGLPTYVILTPKKTE